MSDDADDVMDMFWMLGLAVGLADAQRELRVACVEMMLLLLACDAAMEHARS